MSQKTITILAIALIVLVGIFFIQKYLSHPSKDLASFSQLKIPFDTTAVEFVQVFKQDYPDSGLFFARQDTNWILTNSYNALARNADVRKVISDLATVGGEVRGESDSLYPDFDITDQEALQIKLLGIDSSVLAHVYVGKGGQDGHSCFMRLPGSPKVYFADNNFLSRFSAWGASPATRLAADRWMNLNLCRINRESISSIKLHTPKTEYEFALITEPPADTASPPTTTWQQLEPKKGTPLDEGKIKGMQSNIGSMVAQGVVDPANAIKSGLDKPSYTIWAADSLGHSASITFGNKVDTLGTRYAMVGGLNTVYEVNKWNFERIFVTPFEKPTTAPTSSKKAKK
jgi:hypothetical protein